MTRFSAFALALAPVMLAVTSAPMAAQAAADNGLAEVQAHLRAVNSLTANFSQRDRRGQTLTGTLTLKQPGRIRFDYGRGANMLIVGDGRALSFVDYDARQVQRWPIGDSPLSVLLTPGADLSRYARVTRNDAQVLTIQARDPRRREFGTITLAFSRSGSGAPGGLTLQGWTAIDAQNNVTTVTLTNQRFNVPVADSVFRYRDPRPAGPRG